MAPEAPPKTAPFQTTVTDVTLKPTQSTGGGGMNVGPGLAGP